jgi:hypothetical protein
MPCEVVSLRVDFFQNGCRCHGNCQNSKKLKNTKMIIAGYSPLLQNFVKVGSEFNIFCTLVTMATVTILNLFKPPNSCHTLQWILWLPLPWKLPKF